MEWFRLWWHQTDHYDRLTAHLAIRGLAGLYRSMTATIAAVLAVLSLGTIWIPGGADSVVGTTLAISACLGASSGALLWALRSPTRAQAVRFAIVSIVSIALVSVAQSDPTIAVMTCTAFAMLSSYIALFHASWLLALNLACAVVIGAVEGVRLIERLNLAAALCYYLLLLLLNLAVPSGVLIVSRVLGGDAVLAERDQLTGLFTRRAFQRRARACLELGVNQQAYVVVTVIDLDRFKQLNDSYGHSTGDDALVLVARALREASDNNAVIGRSGGEEFVIADICQPDDVDRRAQQLCEEIAALPFGVTASIGTAGVHPAYRTGNRGDLLSELMAAADAAMYAAKRRGGNQVGHHVWPSPPPLTNLGEDAGGYRDGLSA